jgi:hypothetical protein
MAKFWSECRAKLQAAPPEVEERKVVSVLFVDPRRLHGPLPRPRP